MPKQVVKKMVFIIFFALQTAYSAPSPIPLTLDLQDVPISQALQELAKFLNLNLIISPNVSGTISLHLHDASPNDAFDTLLDSQALAKTLKGSVWYIVPQEELVKHQQDQVKLQQALNESTPMQTTIWHMRYAKAEDIGHLLQDSNASLLSKHGQVRVDQRTNSLCLQDLPERLKATAALIQQLDVPVQQVLIEARLASVDNDYERNLGIDFSVRDPSVHLSEEDSEKVSTENGRFSLAVASLANGTRLDVALSALEKEGKGELISSPSLFTSNQKTAVIESGEEIPYQEVSRSGSTGIAFKKAVVSLRVTPQIMPNGYILLQLHINQDKPSNRIVLGVPAISTRQITTNILVKNRQTIVLGGIYEQNKDHIEQRIPFLGKIPLVGWLFQQQNDLSDKRELLIFVTPKIMTQ